MQHKEFVILFENNMVVLDWLAGLLKTDLSSDIGYPRQHLRTLMRLHLGGKALLKDIAKRDDISPSNLCLILKRLEKDGLVLRQIDDADRRNTWYSLTPAGTKTARRAVDELRALIAELFSNMNKNDEARLTDALRTMNEVLNKIKSSY